MAQPTLRNRPHGRQLQAYRTTLNKAFTIEIDGLLSMRARIAQQNQALSPDSLRVLGRGSVNKSNTCAVWLGGDGPFVVGPQSVLTVCVKGWRTRSVNIDSNDARATGGAGSCSLAFAKA